MCTRSYSISDNAARRERRLRLRPAFSLRERVGAFADRGRLPRRVAPMAVRCCGGRVAPAEPLSRVKDCQDGDARTVIVAPKGRPILFFVRRVELLRTSLRPFVPQSAAGPSRVMLSQVVKGEPDFQPYLAINGRGRGEGGSKPLFLDLRPRRRRVRVGELLREPRSAIVRWGRGPRWPLFAFRPGR